MRAREILDEDYSSNLSSALTDLLVNYKGVGKSVVPLNILVSKMQHSGFSVNATNILDLLQDNPVVTNVTPDSVQINADHVDSNKDDMSQDSAAKVSSMARKASKIG